MQVRRLHIFPIEAIVRGYITGSAWKEYTSQGTVHGLPMPAGLREAEAFPGGAIYTPSTKAEQGDHGKLEVRLSRGFELTVIADENIHPDRGESVTATRLR